MTKQPPTPRELADSLVAEFGAYEAQRDDHGQTQWVHWLRMARGPHNMSGVAIKIYRQDGKPVVELNRFGHSADTAEPWRVLHPTAIKWEIRNALQKCFGR